MSSLTRRGFVGALGASATVGAAMPWHVGPRHRPPPSDGPVTMAGDGINLSPAEYAALLARLTAGREVSQDAYLLGGEIEAFERGWATTLGKEMAVFMPSGTLANQLALRALAGTRRRVIVQDVSHVYNDTGDACQTLSGLTLIPVGPGKASYYRRTVEDVIARGAGGRVATDVGAVLIESPIRRLNGQLFDLQHLKEVCAFCREAGIGTHLDGARLFPASAYTGISPQEYASHFDTVYVSLYKYFNSGFGAILAGPRRLLEGMYHTRRMFGGSLAHGWQAAVVSSYYQEGFLDRFKAAIAVSNDFVRGLEGQPRLGIERIPAGTNLTTLKLLNDGDWAPIVPKLLDQGIRVPSGARGPLLTIGVNETWNRMPGEEIAARFRRALG